LKGFEICEGSFRLVPAPPDREVKRFCLGLRDFHLYSGAKNRPILLSAFRPKKSGGFHRGFRMDGSLPSSCLWTVMQAIPAPSDDTASGMRAIEAEAAGRARKLGRHWALAQQAALRGGLPEGCVSRKPKAW